MAGFIVSSPSEDNISFMGLDNYSSVCVRGIKMFNLLRLITHSHVNYRESRSIHRPEEGTLAVLTNPPIQHFTVKWVLAFCLASSKNQPTIMRLGKAS